MSYANQLTFFCGCIALHSRLMAWSCRRRTAADVGGSAVPGSDTPARYRPKVPIRRDTRCYFNVRSKTEFTEFAEATRVD